MTPTPIRPDLVEENAATYLPWAKTVRYVMGVELPEPMRLERGWWVVGVHEGETLVPYAWPVPRRPDMRHA